MEIPTMLGGHVATSFESDQVDHRWRTGLNTAQLTAEASDNKGERGGLVKIRNRECSSEQSDDRKRQLSAMSTLTSTASGTSNIPIDRAKPESSRIFHLSTAFSSGCEAQWR